MDSQNRIKKPAYIIKSSLIIFLTAYMLQLSKHNIWIRAQMRMNKNIKMVTSQAGCFLRQTEYLFIRLFFIAVVVLHKIIEMRLVHKMIYFFRRWCQRLHRRRLPFNLLIKQRNNRNSLFYSTVIEIREDAYLNKSITFVGTNNLFIII
mgnify:CR=1 FL=1